MTGSPANHEGSGRANIDGIIVFQLFGEKSWTKSLVSANVGTSEENHQSHRLHFAIPNARTQPRRAEDEGPLATSQQTRRFPALAPVIALDNWLMAFLWPF